MSLLLPRFHKSTRNIATDFHETVYIVHLDSVRLQCKNEALFDWPVKGLVFWSIKHSRGFCTYNRTWISAIEFFDAGLLVPSKISEVHLFRYIAFGFVLRLRAPIDDCKSVDHFGTCNF